MGYSKGYSFIILLNHSMIDFVCRKLEFIEKVLLIITRSFISFSCRFNEFMLGEMRRSRILGCELQYCQVLLTH